MSGLSDLEIGFLHWVNQNTNRALKHRAYLWRLEEDDLLRKRIPELRLDRKVLTAKGLEIRTLSVTMPEFAYQRTSFGFSGSDGKTQHSGPPLFKVFRSAQLTDLDLNHTVLNSLDNEIARKTGVVPWSNNSCAVDSVIHLSISLDAFRLQADHLDLKDIGELKLPSALLRVLCLSPWGALSPDQRSQLRNELSKGLDFHDPTKLRVGQHIAVHDVVLTLFEALPQVGYNIGQVTVCCGNTEGPRVISYPNEPKKMYYLQPTIRHEDTLEKALENFMCHNRISKNRGTSPCGNKACSMQLSRRRVLLDRLPPTMVILFDGHDMEKAQKMRMFAAHTIPYWLLTNERLECKSQEYELRAVILLQSAHFVLRVMETDGKISHWDSMRKEVRRVRSWEDALPHDTKVLVAVLRVVKA